MRRIAYYSLDARASKSQLPDMRQASGQGDGGEILTPPKSPIPNMCQADWKGDSGEIHTALKSPVPDMRQAGRKGNICHIR